MIRVRPCGEGFTAINWPSLGAAFTPLSALWSFARGLGAGFVESAERMESPVVIRVRPGGVTAREDFPANSGPPSLSLSWPMPTRYIS